MKPTIFSDVLIASLILITVFAISPVSATIPVNASEIGSNYIRWSWDAGGGNATAIFIDSISTCGYDMNSTTFLLADLNPEELHTIVVWNETDSGTNSTYTTYANGTYVIVVTTTATPTPGIPINPAGKSSSGTLIPILNVRVPLDPSIAIIAIAAVVLVIRRKE